MLSYQETVTMAHSASLDDKPQLAPLSVDEKTNVPEHTFEMGIKYQSW